VLSVFVSVCALGVASASASGAFRLLSDDQDFVHSDGERFVVFGDYRTGFISVLDGRRHRTRKVRIPRACAVGSVGGTLRGVSAGRALLFCGLRDVVRGLRRNLVLDLRAGTLWEPPYDVTIDGESREVPYYDRIGRHWLSGLVGSCGPSRACVVFLNRETGERRVSKDLSTQFDLDAEAFTPVPPCSGFRLTPPDFYEDLRRYSFPYLLTGSDGRFSGAGLGVVRCGQGLLRVPRVRDAVTPTLPGGRISWTEATTRVQRLGVFDLIPRRLTRFRSPTGDRPTFALHTRYSVYAVAVLRYRDDDVPDVYRLYEKRLPMQR
jgi:hypothetical protein